MLRNAAFALITTTLALLTGCSTPTLGQQITRSIGALQEVQSSKQAVDAAVLAKAQGIAIVDESQWALVVGGASGRGVLLRKQTDGTWSAPCAIKTSALSAGLSVGGEARSVVYVFDKGETLDQLIGDGNFFLANAQGTFGSSHGQTSEPPKSSGDVHAYVVGSGLFASAALGNMTMTVDDEINRAAYGEKVNAWDILDGEVKAPPESRALASRLDRITNGRQAAGNANPRVSTTPPTPPNAVVVETPVETAASDEPATPSRARRPDVPR